MRDSTYSGSGWRGSCRSPRNWGQRLSRPESDEDGAFRVRGRRIERIAAQTNFDIEESAERFQRDLQRMGIDAELRRAGVRPGDLVRIGASELEWEAEPWESR